MSELKASEVIETLRYVKKFAGRTLLIKLGGAALEEASLVKDICQDLALMRAIGIHVVIVHGGGPAINEELLRRNIQWEFVDGQRVTSPQMMEVIEMVLCGSVNRRLVRTFIQEGINAVGFSGVDAKTLFCRQVHPSLGLVGKIEKVNLKHLHSILYNASYEAIPVIAPVGVGLNGEIYNINADVAASRLAAALNVEKLIFLTDQNGILDHEKNLLPELDAAELEALIENKTVSGGMLAKAQTIIYSLQNRVSEVHVLNARRKHSLIEELFTERGVGTICRLRNRTISVEK